jgi:hypothetical protein
MQLVAHPVGDPFTKASSAQEFLEKTKDWIQTPKTFTLETEFVNENSKRKVYFFEPNTFAHAFGILSYV